MTIEIKNLVIYTLLLHDWSDNEHSVLGTFSSKDNALKYLEGYMADCFGFSEFTDWDLDPIAGTDCYFYEGFTGEIQRTIVDDGMEDD